VRTRPDPTQDPDVVGLINAQIAAAQRFANAQISNFNQRLENLHDDDRGGDHQGIQIGSTDGDPCARQDPFNPLRGCPQPGGPSAAVGTATDALAYAPGDPAVNKAKAKPLTPRRDFAFWSAGYVSFGNVDPTGQRSGIDFTTSGLTAGMDYRFNQYFVAGAGIGYGRDSTKIGVNGTTSRGEAFNAALYGSLRPYRNFFLDAVVGYGALSFDSQRFVVDDASFVFGQRTGRQLFGSFTGGYTYRDGRLLLSPYARINAAWLTLDQFTESGGPGALIYSEQTATFMTSVLGLRGKYTFPTNWGSISPRFRIEYNHDFRGNGAASLRYADLLGPTYVLTTEPAERDRMTLGLGTDFLVGNTLKLAADYQYDVDFLGAPWHRYRLRLDSRW
jgi:outer membrane autotransporter protein